VVTTEMELSSFKTPSDSTSPVYTSIIIPFIFKFIILLLCIIITISIIYFYARGCKEPRAKTKIYRAMARICKTRRQYRGPAAMPSEAKKLSKFSIPMLRHIMPVAAVGLSMAKKQP